MAIPSQICISLVGAALIFGWQLAMATPVLAADTTPPESTHVLDGVMGNEDWYITNVDVNLRASDLESGPASTTYQLNSRPPVTTTYETDDNAIINPSFESGWIVGINNWQPVYGDASLLYQGLSGHDGYRSAAIASLESMYQYWTNRNSYVPAVEGKSYTVSTWIKTFNLTTAPGAWFEVWALDSSESRSDLKIASSTPVLQQLDWTLRGVSFTVPAGYDGVYVKLGSQSSAGITWYDGVSMRTGSDALTQFLITDNGRNRLTYFSEDAAGNIESEHEVYPIKVDTVEPQQWQEFEWQRAGNNHTYETWVRVQDVTSGIVPSTAEFQWYDKSDCNCWKDWEPVVSVRRADNGQPAPYGYTGLVILNAPPTDMGNSSINTKPKVRFRIQDVASLVGQSPDYALFGPWLKVNNGGDIFAAGGIASLGVLPEGQANTSGVIMSGGSVYNVKSFYDWIVYPYQHAISDGPTMVDFIPQYDQIKARAESLPGNRLPTEGGIYHFIGNYTIDQNSLSAGFSSSAFGAVIIIEGNLNINRNFSLHANSAVAFLVEGNITFTEDVSQSAGVMVVTGTINTNGSSDDPKKTASLTHAGSFIAGQDLRFGRDLGRNKNDNPAEIINFPAHYYAHLGFASLFGSQEDAKFEWQEID